jgi:predicted flap endonuclease-1-like 5' DNA nuclease
MNILRVTFLSLAILAVGFLVGILVGGIGTTLNSMAFLALPVLIIGFLVGWLVEWIIDNEARRRFQAAEAQADAEDDAPSLEVLALTEALREAIAGHENQAQALREAIAGQENQVQALREATVGHKSQARALREATAGYENQAQALREAIAGHESQAKALKEAISGHETQAHALREELTAQGIKYGHLWADFQHYAQTHRDDLTAIKGVGRTLQRKLRDAGYETYAQLARADIDHLREALGIKPWQKADPQEWVDEARVLARTV